MPSFIAFFTYEHEAWRNMVRHPEDRASAAATVVEAAGGSLVAFYWMLGGDDGVLIFEAPDHTAAAAVAAAIAASGRVRRHRTAALLTATEAREALGRASGVARAYAPPGGPPEGWRVDFEEGL